MRSRMRAVVFAIGICSCLNEASDSLEGATKADRLPNFECEPPTLGDSVEPASLHVEQICTNDNGSFVTQVGAFTKNGEAEPSGFCVAYVSGNLYEPAKKPAVPEDMEQIERIIITNAVVAFDRTCVPKNSE